MTFGPVLWLDLDLLDLYLGLVPITMLSGLGQVCTSARRLLTPRSVPLGSFLRSTLEGDSVMPATAATTRWSAATPWAACRVLVTLAALCLEGAATSALDSVCVGKAWRACSAPTARTTTITTTAVHSSGVRGCGDGYQR